MAERCPKTLNQARRLSCAEPPVTKVDSTEQLVTTRLNPQVSRFSRHLAQLCLLGIGLLMAACKPNVSAQAAAPIRLGTYQWPGSFWIEIATAKGWFKEEGLNVERIDVDTK